jgi:glycosyltransferase involved in cell wall biosynthesis
VKKYDKILVHHTSPILIAIHPIFYGFFYRTEKYLWDLDIWPDTLTALGVIKSNLILKLIESIVIFIYSFYDKILISSKGFREIIENRFKGEIIYFPNWAESIIEKNIHNPKIITNLPLDSFIIMYTGNIGQAQNFNLLAKTINYLKNQKIHWVFIGEGSFKKTFIKTLKRYKVLNKCQFINQVNVSEIPSYTHHSDALFLSLIGNDLFSKTVPAKLQTYMALGKPIIASIKGEGADLIRKSNSGIVEKNSSYIELASSINKLLKLDNTKMKSIGKNGRKFYEQNFHSKLRKNQILNLFK